PPVACPGCWHPPVAMSWQWQLSGTIDTSIDVQMYDVDGFETPASVVDELHGAGRLVVCYLSAGSKEQWRPDAGRFPSRVVGSPLDGWPGERWLDVRRWKVLGPIMRDRIDRCVDKGFDAVEFDNVDAWSNRSGFPLTREDQLRYNIRLANASHERGLATFLKNDVEQAATLEPYFDAALNEECFSYDECDRLTPFIDAGKPVFAVEYELNKAQFCPEATTLGFNAMKKKWNLGV
ncbi:MAG: endo alpha-1,4 polygalactosaminidase, partial [Actinomycetota bacterium]